MCRTPHPPGLQQIIGEICHRRIITETWGDVLIRGLWESQTDSRIDVRFKDADSKTYEEDGLDTIFPRWEKLIRTSTGRNATSNGNVYRIYTLG